jgi:hypothetical protein
VRLRQRLTPYILLGVLTLGTGLGIGLGLAGSGTSGGPSGSIPVRALSPCSLVPASSVGALINQKVMATRLSNSCGYLALPPSRTGALPQLSVRVSSSEKAVSTFRKLLDPKTKVFFDGKAPPPGDRRHFIRVDGTSAMWLRLAETPEQVSVTISAVKDATVIQVTVGGVANAYLVAHKMMEISLDRSTAAS